LVAAAVIALTGCTGKGAAPAPTALNTATGATDRVGPDPKISPPPPFAGVQHALPSGPALANDPSLYKEAALTGCSATARGWKGTGTLENPGRHASTARITVLFTDAQARDVASATATVKVAAGRTARWTAARRFDAPEGTRCVLRAVRSAG
jgi:hypothetical protein